LAKLAIYRGEALDREVELAPRTARLGRSDQNEIVLADPSKSVSRFHAELRFEDGAFVLADLNSQNGTWVGGRRVQQVTLDAERPVVIGTYRLVFVPDSPAADGDRTLLVPAVNEAPPSVASPHAPLEVLDGFAPPPLPPVVAPGMEPAFADPAPAIEHAGAEPLEIEAAALERPKVEAVHPEPPKSTAISSVPARPPVPPASPSTAPAAPSPAHVTAPPPKPAAGLPGRPAPKRGLPLMVVAGLVLVLAAAAAGLFFWPKAGSAPARPAEPAAQAADVPMPGGPPTETPGAAPAAAPSEPVTQSPAPSAALSEPAAPPPAAQAPPPEPAPASTAAKPAPPKPARAAAESAAAARKDAASKKAVPEPKTRGVDPAPALDRARSAINRGDYLSAINTLEGLLRTSPGQADAAQMLETARVGARNAAQAAVDTGAKAESAGEYESAARHFEQAQQLDPGSQPAADGTRRVRARMQADGEDAFKRGKQFDALGRNADAVGMYEKAIRLLPAEHPSARAARERLAALKGGN
jgi:hypothetical protein